MLDQPTAPRWRDLTPSEQAWVDQTRDSLDAEARIGQLFNFAVNDEPAAIETVRGLGAGAFHRFPGAELGHARDVTRALLEHSPVPPLLSGDIEGGESGFGFATSLLNQLGIAAADDPALTYELARIAAEEARAIGCNWSFAPVVDINAAFRSTVVGTRSYGSDVERILAHASAHIAATQAAGFAACAKHWPGEGYDDRDQHLLTTVNPLGMDAWHASFGRIYRTLIEQGVMTIMAGHIALPAYAKVRNRSAFAPASVSSALNVDLLRGELGFRGLLVSDASVMGGLTSWMDRAQAVPAIIENGCDMLLFSRDPAGDVAFMREGLRSGRLSEARVDEAVTRVLTLKALLGLHRAEIDDRLPEVVLQTRASQARAGEVAAKSLTLVKDVPGLLPLSPARHKRVVVAAESGQAVFIDGAEPRSFAPLYAALRAAGFEVRDYDPELPPTPDDTDLLLYIVGREATPVIASAHIDWASLHGSAKKAMRRHLGISTLMVAFGHPYLLYDAPWVGTFVNAYSAIEPVQRALVAALTGVGFPGRSPVDALCGRTELGL